MSRNLLILLSDQHRRDAMGCAGHPVVETPHLDALAARGTRFTRAFCNAPICVPSRASLATGLPIHEIPSWDNADPYHGQRTSFMHRAREAGAEVVSIGKLHFRSEADDTGFTRQVEPLHVVNGTGTFTSLIRQPMPRIAAAADLLRGAGAGDTGYAAYDQRVAEAACDWLRGREDDAPPFLLFASFVNPHPPYVAPRALFERYLQADLPLPDPAQLRAAVHPGLEGLRTYFDIEGAGLDAAGARAIAAAYLANVTALDARIGAVLSALEAAGLREETTVLYTSDHGEALGDHGLYGKCNLLEPSMGVPMILAGPDVPRGERRTPVQLLDVYPTVTEALGLAGAPADARRSGSSLLRLAAEPDRPRTILAQQHCAGAATGTYGLSDGRWKYICAVDGPELLFDLAADPGETRNLAGDPAQAETLAGMRRQLRARLDPEAVEAACKASQARRLAAAGGRAAVLGRPLSAYTPAPGETAR
jgi:choline-sulfatase